MPVCLPGICACSGATISLSLPADVTAVCCHFSPPLSLLHRLLLYVPASDAAQSEDVKLQL